MLATYQSRARKWHGRIPQPQLMGDNDQMTQVGRPPLSALGELLINRMGEVGMTRQRDLSIAAGVSPSSIHRVMFGTMRPGVDVLHRIAQALDLNPDQLVKFVYGSRPGPGEPDRPTLHPRVAELQRMLDPESPLTDEDRKLLEILVDRIMDPHRRDMRRAVLPIDRRP